MMIMGQESKITDFVKNYNNDDITIDKLHLKDVFATDKKKMIILTDHILSKYQLDLEDQIITYTMTSNEERKYFQNPKVLSYDRYGTTELWFLLLELNELKSASEFILNPIKIYKKTIMNRIAKILNLEKGILDENADYITKSLLE